MSTVRLPPAFRHMVKVLPEVAYHDQCGMLARPFMIIGGASDVPPVSCVLRRGHERRHVGGISSRRRWFGRISGWSCYSWGRSGAE